MAVSKKTRKQNETQPDITEPKLAPEIEDRLTRLMRHYLWGVQDMDTRRVRKNGWNEIINAYMGKLPANWPYQTIVTVPLIRTTILEKTSRLLNAKLQGKLVPRNDEGDMVKAKINNSLLDFQWDLANEGGSMFEKVALADQYCRIFGAAFAFCYWDNVKDSNEIKIIDPRDMFFDGAATHIKNAKWVQIREFTTLDKLEQRGYDVKDARKMAEQAQLPPMRKDTRYESIVKANRALTDRTGEIDDIQNPIVEVVTEWGFDRNQVPYCVIFLPTLAMILDEKSGKNYPYKHNKIPLSMLRYYPLLDDIYGESEVEPVLPLQRAANAMVDGFIDEANIKIRPPLKISASGVRMETIEWGPGAKWIMNNPDQVQEHQSSPAFLQSFNTVYPMIVNAFNEAMGSTSLGISQNPTQATSPAFGDKTATEVNSITQQQNTRDMYNQNYLSQFLKDIMMMWLENNKQYIFDDPTKKTYILKIIGKSQIQELQQMNLDGKQVPDFALQQIANTVVNNPGMVSNEQIGDIMDDVAIPTNPVIENPTADPEDYITHPKLEISDNKQEAKLWITPDDFIGEYDYIPDVKQMQAGAGAMQKEARMVAMQTILNPEVMQLLNTQGDTVKIKELLINEFEDNGMRDAETLFEPFNQPGMMPGMQNGQPNQPGAGAPQPMQPGAGMAQPPSVGGPSQAVPSQPVLGGLPPAAGQPKL